MRNKHLIRKAIKSDIEKIIQFERLYIIEHESEKLYKWDSVKEKTINLLNENLDAMFVCENRGVLVGHCYWNFYDEKPCIFSIYVELQYRHLGIAKKLLSVVESDAAFKGFKVMTLSTLIENPANKFFIKKGYQKVKFDHESNYYTKLISK